MCLTVGSVDENPHRIVIGGLHEEDLFGYVQHEFSKYFRVVKWGLSEDDYHYEAVLEPKSYELLQEYLKKPNTIFCDFCDASVPAREYMDHISAHIRLHDVPDVPGGKDDAH